VGTPNIAEKKYGGLAVIYRCPDVFNIRIEARKNLAKIKPKKLKICWQ